MDKLDTNLPSEELIGDRRASALSQLAITRDRWQWLLEHLDRPFHEYRERWPHAPLEDAAATPASVFHALRDMVVRVSWKREMQAELEQLFSGNTDGPILAAIRAIQQKCCAAACLSRCTCMPATATSTPTCRSTPTITRCCKARTRRWSASWRWRAPWAE